MTLSHANLWAGMHTVVEYLRISADDRNSIGPVRLAVRNSGGEAVRAALTEGLEPHAAPDGTFRIVDEYGNELPS